MEEEDKCLQREQRDDDDVDDNDGDDEALAPVVGELASLEKEIQWLAQQSICFWFWMVSSFTSLNLPSFDQFLVRFWRDLKSFAIDEFLQTYVTFVFSGLVYLIAL